MKRFIVILVILVLGISGWFISRPYDVKVRLEFRTFPGTIIQTIKTWGNGLYQVEYVSQDSTVSITQRVLANEITHLIDWQLEMKNDSICELTAFISNETGTFGERLMIPFQETRLEASARQLMSEFRLVMKELLNDTKVEVQGITETDSVFCVFMPLESVQQGKAYGMMSSFSLLTDFILENELVSKGPPIIEVEDWSISSDKLLYNFCFPIVPNDSLPVSTYFSYKWMAPKKALKAVYNGNYINSDRAWFALVAFADRNDIAIERKPIEVFYNNPNLGGNETDWKAEIFMPIVE